MNWLEREVVLVDNVIDSLLTSYFKGVGKEGNNPFEKEDIEQLKYIFTKGILNNAHYSVITITFKEIFYRLLNTCKKQEEKLSSKVIGELFYLTSLFYKHYIGTFPYQLYDWDNARLAYSDYYIGFDKAKEDVEDITYETIIFD